MAISFDEQGWDQTRIPASRMADPHPGGPCSGAAGQPAYSVPFAAGEEPDGRACLTLRGLVPRELRARDVFTVLPNGRFGVPAAEAGGGFVAFAGPGAATRCKFRDRRIATTTSAPRFACTSSPTVGSRSWMADTKIPVEK